MFNWQYLLNEGGAGGGSDDPPENGGGGNDDPPESVPYNRFKEVIDERNDLKDSIESMQKQLAGMKGQLEKQKKPLEKKVDELSGQLDEVTGKLEKTEQEREQERLRRLRVEVATEHGIPTSLAGRLQGDDREAIEDDAKSLVEYIKTKEGPGVPPTGGGGGAPSVKDWRNMTPAEIRENADEIWETAVQGK